MNYVLCLSIDHTEHNIPATKRKKFARSSIRGQMTQNISLDDPIYGEEGTDRSKKELLLGTAFS